jgi:hypothetical protein
LIAQELTSIPSINALFRNLLLLLLPERYSYWSLLSKWATEPQYPSEYPFDGVHTWTLIMMKHETNNIGTIFSEQQADPHSAGAMW